MKINKFDRPSCKIVGEAVDQALKGVADKFGITIKRKSGTFSENNYTIKIEASVIGENGLAISKEAEAFKQMAQYYGLAASDLNKKFTNWSGKEYQIVGLATKSSKYPILAKEIDSGKTFKFAEKQVQDLLNKSEV